MRLHVINPNTSDDMTASIGQIAIAHVSGETEVLTTCPAHGPASIESYYDEYLAIPHVLAEVQRTEATTDGYVLACWGDPGLDAVREITAKPVVGIAEASMFAASAIAPRWSVITTLRRSHHMVEAIVKKTGLIERCASIRCVDLPVLACEADPDAVLSELAHMGKLALTEDGAEAIILGCAGMGGMADSLSAQLSAPCVDPVAAGVRFAEMLVNLNLQTSKWLTYRSPEHKTFR
ncbi:MAG: aspartate/glutamate racemase family protein [Cyanobacteria bacterium J069]|nr:MAG: aspartate/glutamate racemase family protein [Cyanobacteria bacterium J069]